VPLLIVFAALLGGVIGHFDFGGRLFSFSWIDGVAVGVLAAGAVSAWRRRQVRLDPVLLAYAGILGVVALQVALFDGVWDLVGGATRFMVPTMLVAGLSQLLPDSARTAERPPWRWPMVVGAFGTTLAVWTTVQAARGFLDPARSELYEIKAAIVVPMGASNYLASFLLVAFVVSAAFVARDRRYLVPAAVCGIGLFATLSRGAMLALFVVVLLAAVLGRSRHVLAAGTAVVLGSAAVAVGLAVFPVSEPAAPVGPTPVPVTEAEQPDADEGSGRNGLAVLGGEVPGRLHLFRTAWTAFREHPVLGVGMNRVATTNAIDGIGHPNVHNLLLHSLVSIGLLGTAGYIALYVVLVLRIRRMPQRTERLALGFGLLALLLHAQVEAVAFTRAAEVLLAVMLCVAAVRTGVPVRRFGRSSPGPHDDDPTAALVPVETGSAEAAGANGNGARTGRPGRQPISAPEPRPSRPATRGTRAPDG
jgi:hypothetical protein